MADVLIADNNEKDRKKLIDFLEKDGFTVFILKTKNELEKMIEEHPFTAIILDHSFEGNDVCDLIQLIHQKSESAQAQVVLTTRISKKDILSKYISLGVNDLLMKPYRYVLLKDKMIQISKFKKGNSGAFDPLILKIFLESTIHIFDVATHFKIVAGKPFLKTENKSLAEIGAMIELRSQQVKGSFSIYLNKNLLKRILFKMLGNKVEGSVAIFADVCCELCNQIVGCAKQQFLKKKSMTFEIAIPSVLTENDSILNYKKTSPTLVIPFFLEKTEPIYVEFCLELNNDIQDEAPEKLKIAVEEGEVLIF